MHDEFHWMDCHRHRVDVAAIIRDKLDEARKLQASDPARADWHSVITRLLTFLDTIEAAPFWNASALHEPGQTLQ